MYSIPNAEPATPASTGNIQIALVCNPASTSAVVSIGKNSPPTTSLSTNSATRVLISVSSTISTLLMSSVLCIPAKNPALEKVGIEIGTVSMSVNALLKNLTS